MKTVLTGENQTDKLIFEMVVTFWSYALASGILPSWPNSFSRVLHHVLVYGKAKVSFYQTVKAETKSEEINTEYVLWC